MLKLCSQLFTAVASTAGLERIFSSYGLVHSKLRNKLGNQKAAKLAFLFKSMNQHVTDKHTPFNTRLQSQTDTDAPSTSGSAQLHHGAEGIATDHEQAVMESASDTEQ